MIFFLVLSVCLSSVAAVNLPQQSRYVRQVSNGITANSMRVSKDDLQDAKMMMEIDTPWEQFLMPAPTVIALLGGLTVLSGKVDFSLNERPPAAGFKYVRHPDSFRASLVQVSNDGWSAFHNAHRNMDTIQLNMQQIPVHVKTAMKIIAESPADLFQDLLEVPLSSIKDIGKTSVDLAKETELKFLDVMLLMGEILESTVSGKGLYDMKLAAARMELNASVVQKQSLDNIGSMLEKREKQLSQAVAKYQAAYESAMNSIPTGWELIGQKFVAGLADGVNSFVKMTLNPIGAVKGLFSGSGSSGGGGQGAAAGRAQSGGDDNIMNTMALVAVESLFNLIQDIRTASNNVFKGQIKENPREKFATYEGLLGSLKNTLVGYSGSQIATKASGFLQSAQDLVVQMKSLSGISSNITEEKKSEVLSKFDNLISAINPFYVAAVASKQDVSTGKPPATSGADFGSSGSSNVVDQGSDNARFKAQMYHQQLQETERQYDKVFDDMMKQQEAMKNLMVRMATLNMETINYQEIIDLMKEGIQTLSEIRKQWSKLTEFFAMIAVRAEFTVKQLLNPFVRIGETLQQKTQISDATRNFMLRLLVPQAQEIHKAAYFIYTLSKTYVSVSSRYIMDRLAGLAGLTTIEPSQRAAALAELRKNSESASDEIKQMVQQKRLDYKRMIQQKIAEGQTYLQSLGGTREADTLAVKKGLEAVQKKKEDPDSAFVIDP